MSDVLTREDILAFREWAYEKPEPAPIPVYQWMIDEFGLPTPPFIPIQMRRWWPLPRLVRSRKDPMYGTMYGR